MKSSSTLLYGLIGIVKSRLMNVKSTGYDVAKSRWGSRCTSRYIVQSGNKVLLCDLASIGHSNSIYSAPVLVLA